MDIIKCFDWKMRELNSQSTGGEDSKRPHDETTNRTSTPTSPGNNIWRELEVRWLYINISQLDPEHRETGKGIIFPCSGKQGETYQRRKYFEWNNES